LTAILVASSPIIAGCGDDKSAVPDASPPMDGSVDAPQAPTEPALTFFDYVQAVDLTPDGHTALFGDISTPVNQLMLVDTWTMTATHATDVGDPLRDFATGISQGGAITALYDDPVVAGLWKPGAGWTNLGTLYPTPCDQDIASAWDISADGTVVVGSAWNTCAVGAFRWTASGMAQLQVLGARTGGGAGIPDNRATVVSDDGSIAAGFAMTAIVDRAPARWHADGTGEFLPRSAPDAPGEVLSISANGHVLAGLDALDGVVWTDTDKQMLPRFDDFLPSDPVFPNAMTADGRVIFGGQGDAFSGIPQAFMWSQANGLRRISDLVAAQSLAIPTGFVMGNVLAASADGTVLIGTATNPDTFASKVWVLRLPAAAIN
jgi:hypothetical protein